MLTKRNDEPRGLPLPLITRQDHRRQIRQSRIDQAKNQLKEFGVVIFFDDLLCRRLKLPRLKIWVALRLHEIERAHLQ